MEKKENFLKRAFKDMAQSTREQHEVDKANFATAKAEAKANFEENRGSNTWRRAKASSKEYWENAKLSSSEKHAKKRQEQQVQIAEAEQRLNAANERIEKAKLERKN